MTSHQEDMEDLCLELMNAWASLHDAVKTLRVQLRDLNAHAAAAETALDREMTLLLDRVNQVRQQLEDELVPDPMASDR
jgi:hypothetical protein